MAPPTVPDVATISISSTDIGLTLVLPLHNGLGDIIPFSLCVDFYIFIAVQ